MKKLITFLGALALIAGLNAAPAPVSAQSMGRAMAMDHHCGRHMTWVKGYRNRMGHWVAGHCRAMPMHH